VSGLIVLWQSIGTYHGPNAVEVGDGVLCGGSHDDAGYQEVDMETVVEIRVDRKSEQEVKMTGEKSLRTDQEREDNEEDYKGQQ
jgi:hypothetical protein